MVYCARNPWNIFFRQHVGKLHPDHFAPSHCRGHRSFICNAKNHYSIEHSARRVQHRWKALVPRFSDPRSDNVHFVLKWNPRVHKLTQFTRNSSLPSQTVIEFSMLHFILFYQRDNNLSLGVEKDVEFRFEDRSNSLRTRQTVVPVGSEKRDFDTLFESFSKENFYFSVDPFRAWLALKPISNFVLGEKPIRLSTAIFQGS